MPVVREVSNDWNIFGNTMRPVDKFVPNVRRGWNHIRVTLGNTENEATHPVDLYRSILPIAQFDNTLPLHLIAPV